MVDRLVDPMLGGVYAGRADDLSLATTMPALARAARVEHTLLGAVRAAQAATPRAPGEPVFGTLAGGLSTLVDGGRDGQRGDHPPARCGTRTAPRPAPGWRLTVGPTRDPEHVDVDAVVLAVPARPAARLLAGVAPGAAAGIGGLDYASVALVTLALPEPALPELSGFLVPATEGLLIKASTFFTTKWGHLRRPDGLALVRASVGRYGEEAQLQRPDDRPRRHRAPGTVGGARRAAAGPGRRARAAVGRRAAAVLPGPPRPGGRRAGRCCGRRIRR